MDINQAVSVLEQFKQEGGDMNALSGAFQALSATGKTSFGLNQWAKSDKPTMDDFNEDNRIIDKALAALSAKKVNVARPQVINLVMSPNVKKYQSCNYMKDGFSKVTVNLSCQYDNDVFMQHNKVLATLPVGYRPVTSIEYGCTVHATGLIAGTIIIDTQGQIILRTFTPDIKYIHAPAAVFLATQ